MRKTKPWFRVYWTDLLADGLAVYFSDAEIGIYYKLYGAARASPTPGIILLNPDDPRDIRALAQRLHTRKDRLTATINKLEKQGKITRDNTGFAIATWDIDQEGPEDSTESKTDQSQGRKRGTKPLIGGSKQPAGLEVDTDKYIKGKYGNMVRR